MFSQVDTHTHTTTTNTSAAAVASTTTSPTTTTTASTTPNIPSLETSRSVLISSIISSRPNTEPQMSHDKVISGKVSPPVMEAQQQSHLPIRPQTSLHPSPPPLSENNKRKASTTSPLNASPPTGCQSATSTTTAGSNSCNSAISQASKRHKPMSLNLNVPNRNADLALRIVSPGLPALDDEMKSTIKLSQRIQQQQRYLIASRRGVDVDQEKFEDNGDTYVDEDIVAQQVSRSTDKDAPGESEGQLSSTSSKSQNTSPMESNKLTGETTDATGQLSLSRSENKENTTTPTTTPTTTKSPVYALDDSDITRLSSLKNRRMKRKNVPAPLNIGTSSNTANNPNSSKPKSHIAPLSIHSAPIRSAPTRPTVNLRHRGGGVFGKYSRPVNIHPVPPTLSSTYRHSMHPSSHNPQQQPYHYLPPPRTARLNNNNAPPMAYTVRQGRPFSSQQQPQHPQQLPRGVRLVPAPSTTAQQFSMRYLPIVPPSSTMLNFQQRQYQQQMQSSQSQRDRTSTVGGASMSNSRPGAVTDVFNDNFQKSTPLHSQPLSSQVEFFKRVNVNGSINQENAKTSDDIVEDVDDDKAPVSQDEIDEMQQKYASSRMVMPQYVPSFQQQQYASANGSMMMTMVPNMAPPASSVVPNGYNSSPLRGGSKSEVFGSINFMNENIFNFRIFERKNKSGEGEQNIDGQFSEVDYDAERQALSTSSSAASASHSGSFSASPLESNDKWSSPNDGDALNNGEGDNLSKRREEKEVIDDKHNDASVNSTNDDAAVEEDDAIKEEEQDKSKEGSQDWLRYEKKKFMKICETCWDEFVKSRSQQG
ncbi:hypothetical protein CORT_0D06630 [Candida orthopsilosis Co 90-125]|uniref:Uncharacterized protein n=1 Tax=Candida orthopsilosis (strain 90-125) TaxID=1136231 RepID=H8X5N9_CANO9|nr:hypothetical protein CORT_0D06630 [Candida orthopsilosis Co 90-125]CCG23497.1 hypothetical protein CORT_0D06630 [Candida orthopsilosis Co 90-125]